jgi:Protein of unknown function (DUF3710)
LFRRRREGQHRSGSPARPAPEPADEEEYEFEDEDGADGYDRYPDPQATAAGQALGTGAGSGEDPAGTGPWDITESYPQRQRVELGSLAIPVVEGWEVQLNVAEEQIIAVTVGQADSSMQVQAFAAPKTGSLWDDVRGEITEEITKLGGQAQEAQGPFGTELQALVPPDPASGATELQPARFVGVDGPRWMLRGVISGAAARGAQAAAQLEDVFGGIVVSRGDHPAPPRDLLPIQLPAEMQEALEQELAAAQQQAQAAQQTEFPNPFERGPEITETR